MLTPWSADKAAPLRKACHVLKKKKINWEIITANKLCHLPQSQGSQPALLQASWGKHLTSVCVCLGWWSLNIIYCRVGGWSCESCSAVLLVSYVIIPFKLFGFCLQMRQLRTKIDEVALFNLNEHMREFLGVNAPQSCSGCTHCKFQQANFCVQITQLYSSFLL